jgi:putative endonuclease
MEKPPTEYYVYVLFSERLGKHYTGYSSDVEKRLLHHNSAQDKFSKKGVPWHIVATFKCADKRAAMQLEKRVKARGAKRYIEDMNGSV